MKGTVYVNNGYWWYAVRLPGEKKRKARKLCAPGSDIALHADRSRDVAILAARKIWEDATRRTPTTRVKSLTVDEIAGGWIAHCEIYYRRKDGTQTGEAWGCMNACRILRKIYGNRPAAELQHADMLAVRDALIRTGIARVTVNRYMERIKRLWRWALDEGLISATQKAELTQVQNLKPNRSEAPETTPVRPVDNDVVDATCALFCENTADMIRVQRLTGMRPGEICNMKWEHIDTSSTPWVYKPPYHKTEWEGKIRAILIGPKARALMEKYRRWDYPFSPQTALDVAMESGCKTRYRIRGIPDKITEKWRQVRYASAIRDATKKAQIEEWAPNRLRHAFATEVRRKYGIMAAGALLGHSDRMKITHGYSYEAAIDELIRDCGNIIETIG